MERDAHLGERPRGDTLPFVDQPEEDVLGPDVVVVEETASSCASTTTRRARSVNRSNTSRSVGRCADVLGEEFVLTTGDLVPRCEHEAVTQATGSRSPTRWRRAVTPGRPETPNRSRYACIAATVVNPVGARLRTRFERRAIELVGEHRERRLDSGDGKTPAWRRGREAIRIWEHAVDGAVAVQCSELFPGHAVWPPRFDLGTHRDGAASHVTTVIAGSRAIQFPPRASIREKTSNRASTPTRRGRRM